MKRLKIKEVISFSLFSLALFLLSPFLSPPPPPPPHGQEAKRAFNVIVSRDIYAASTLPHPDPSCVALPHPTSPSPFSIIIITTTTTLFRALDIVVYTHTHTLFGGTTLSNASDHRVAGLYHSQL